MIDMNGMRQWLEDHEEPALLITRKYRTLIEEKETAVQEYRLMTLKGDMDYTTYVIIPVDEVIQDEDAARARAYKRILWETQRDAGLEIDIARAEAAGSRYNQSQT